jgi:hypothetical protein
LSSWSPQFYTATVNFTGNRHSTSVAISSGGRA